MEKFEMNGDRNLELFSAFAEKTKSAFGILIENIKVTIKEYETKIGETTKDISDNEMSREKCEQEITKMEDKISTIKDAIENVESTYKKMVDAYSSTSKGETKELYSEIIDGAKANCDRDVEKNRSEIARLNSDIEAIKNNISEFTKIIDGLNTDLSAYNTELSRYKSGLEYLEKISAESGVELEAIANKKEETPKKEVKPVKKKTTTKAKTEKEAPEENKKPSILETFETESFKAKKEEEEKKAKAEKNIANEISYEDSLKQIYDLTGYKPSKKEQKSSKETVEKNVVENSKPLKETKEQPVYKDNLENLFAKPTEDVKPEASKQTVEEEDISFLDAEFENWENILNSNPTEEVKADAEVKSSPKKQVDGLEETANQLLSPYGTNMKRLSSLLSGEIAYKDGRKEEFVLTNQDIITAVNSVDGNDLKRMKVVGPEITLLRKVKQMKEGNR